MSSGNLHIAAGVIFNSARDEVLLARRPDDVQQGGLWEFPGGKLLLGETVENGLRRELFEELGLIVDEASRMIIVDHDYPEISVTLDVWSVDKWHGDLSGREGQFIEWVPLDELVKREFPAANRAAIAAVKLPPVYLITPELEQYGKNFTEKLTSYLESGIKLLQFRSHGTDVRQTRDVVPALVNLCNKYECKLMFNGSPEQARLLGAHGVHLSSARLMELTHRPLDENYYVAASCHNLLELKQANKIRADFVVLGPVKHTSSHVNVEPVGWQRYSELVRKAAMPVYGLGGMRFSDMALSREYGGQGVAMISGIWEMDESASMIRTMIRKGASV